MSGGSFTHSQINFALSRVVGTHLLSTPCQGFSQTLKVGAHANSIYFYPDVGIFCGEPELGQGDVLLNSVALFEVLSPSTEKYDRYEKFYEYQKIETLQEYFLVHQERPLVEAFRKTAEGGWESLLYSAYVGLEVVFPIQSAGIEVPLSGIYHGVVFASAEEVEA